MRNSTREMVWRNGLPQREMAWQKREMALWPK